MIRLSLFLFLLISQAGCAAPSASERCGFMIDGFGQRTSWRSAKSVKFYVSPELAVNPEAMPIIMKVAEQYNTVIGKNLVVIAGWAQPTLKPAVRDGVNLISWYAAGATDIRLGFASNFRNGPLILESDISLNKTGYLYSYGALAATGTMDFYSLVLHEMGHTLGLDHSPERASPMFEYFGYSEIRRTLTNNDIANLRCEYD